MTRPIFEPTQPRDVAKNAWDISQLQRRPAPESAVGFPSNDTLQAALALHPLYASGTYTWANSVDGDNIGATLDPFDPIIVLSGDPIGTSQSSVWYLILLPIVSEDPGLNMWASCDFDCVVAAYWPQNPVAAATLNPTEGSPGGPVQWPTNAAHLFMFLAGMMAPNPPHMFPDLFTTGDIMAGSTSLTVVNVNRVGPVGSPIGIAGAYPMFTPPTRITAIVGSTVTVADAATNTVTGADVGSLNPIGYDSSGNPVFASTGLDNSTDSYNLQGAWTGVVTSLPAGTDGLTAWTDNDTGDASAVMSDGIGAGCPVFVEVLGQGAAQGNFTLYWRSPNADGAGGDTTSSLF